MIYLSASCIILMVVCLSLWDDRRKDRRWVKMLEDKHKVLEVNLFLKQHGYIPELKWVKSGVIEGYKFDDKNFSSVDEAVNFIKGWVYEAQGLMIIKDFKIR